MTTDRRLAFDEVRDGGPDPRAVASGRRVVRVGRDTMTRMSRVGLGVYSMAFEVVTWTALVPLMLLRRMPPRELRARLAAVPQVPRGNVLVHAVSAGEMNAAEPIVAALASAGRRVLLTTGTHAGVAAAERLRAAHAHVDGCRFLPWDRRRMRTWIDRVAPSAVVVMETEIWPNLFAACAARGIPLVIANGRMRDREVPRYRLARGFFRDVLGGVTWIGAQSPSDRDAFIAVGAPANRIDVTANLKIEAALASRALPDAVATGLRRRPLIVAGSTHDPEEAWLIDALRELRVRGRDVRLVIAPRRLERVAAIEHLIARPPRMPIGHLAARGPRTPVARGFSPAPRRRDIEAPRDGLRFVRWSDVQSAPAEIRDWDVLVLDEYGWLTAFYDAADLVFLGGTIAPIGGHNIVEPAVRGKPVIVGPDVREIEAMVRELEAAGGVVRLRDREVSSLVTAIGGLLDDPAKRTAIGRAARGATVGKEPAASGYLDVLIAATRRRAEPAHPDRRTI